jgi:hypothetical protein
MAHYSNKLWVLVNKVIKFRSQYNEGKGKGKAIPLQALTVPEGSRRMRLPDFKTIGT